ncbi:MAG: tRNA pseudouridine(55) synthase TruB [Bacteroidetes bacterium]|nr:tRNA pseudouridine(55) synthase TruB [Bacteroidota bacterium]MDA0938034.1 tRNA pseudouridine(55) synthase TruB [Bacteroidota bacterium]MDA1343937.1 tRNA pseudouridine(55) synthase TruB [Bacteroidota bacterium]
MELSEKLTLESVLEGQVLLFDKPLSWTSFQVVNKVRWLLKKKFNLKNIKVGHAGTLDPLATGLLILCTGKMTKKISEYQGMPKTYTGCFLLGATTPSYDLETPIDQQFDAKSITAEQIEKVRKQFLGVQQQYPPVFSALKQQGTRLYELARKGEEVKTQAREITLYSFDLESFDFPTLQFCVQCSKGTYIRALAHDFGKALNNGAHLTQLRRTAIGTYTVENAISLEDFEALLT